MRRAELLHQPERSFCSYEAIPRVVIVYLTNGTPMALYLVYGHRIVLGRNIFRI